MKAKWKCSKCSLIKELDIDEKFTSSNNELMPVGGWVCRKCGMAGRMIFQEII